MTANAAEQSLQCVALVARCSVFEEELDLCNPQVKVVSPTSAVLVEKAFCVSPDALYKVCAGFRSPIFECQKVIHFLVAEAAFLDVVVASEAVGVHGRAALDISRAEAFERFGVGRLDFLYM